MNADRGTLGGLCWPPLLQVLQRSCAVVALCEGLTPGHSPFRVG